MLKELFNKHKKQQAEIEALKQDIAKLQKENNDLKELRMVLQVSRAGKALLDREIKNTSRQKKETLARLLYLKDTVDDINYRTYVTFQKDTGAISIDPEQIPLSREEEKALVEKYK